MRCTRFVLASTLAALPLTPAFAQAPPKDPKMVDTGTKDAATMDREFLMKAAMSNLMEIELGKVALEKAGNGEIKAFGQMMVGDHSGPTPS